ncbi:unnamed protein product, partial [Microthlaspi erraticum]
LAFSREEPWFLTGDFNDIIEYSEKNGGPARTEGSFCDFRAFISQNDLYDIQHSGNSFSWRGMRYTHLVHCRLDRALSNSMWAERFPSSRCYYLDFEGSDHRPLLSILEPNLKKKRGIFRYDRSMRSNEEISKLVDYAWNAANEDTVEQRLAKCRSAISLWNRKHHTNSQKAIQDEKAKLEKAMSSTDLFITKSSECVEIVAHALTPCISPETSETLIATPTTEEIREALFSIHADKAPGPDGFSASFFQSNWSSVKERVTTEIKEIFTSGIVPRSINRTHVRLIPKIPSPKSVAEYRPIALCNVFYKIISKILIMRLQPILPSIISETQTAYVPGRAISDNVLITHEVLHYLKGSGATKHCSMAVKTDMSKAYDRVEWSFIATVLERFGFHARWINLILHCISMVSYSFLVNGAAQGSVIPQRGIRQGDPLSPFIFILCGEVLSGLCRQAQDIGKLPGIRVSRGSPRLNHLLFADATMFFCKTSQQSCESLMTILQKYEKASGIEKEEGKGKYLGLPESFGRKKKDPFTMIVDRIHQRSVHYSSRFLSSAGKLTMLKSVLSAMPTYSMSCFKLPAGLCKRIQSALTRFWWDSKIGERKMCWLSWDKLTRSKRDGGLGFRDIQSYNDAFLAKLSWRILNQPNCLLSRVLQGKYCRDRHFLNVFLPSSTSHRWRGILIGRDLLLQKLGKAIGNGRSTSLWNDPWLSLTTPTCPVGPTRDQDKTL